MEKNTAIIVAGGSGIRMGTDVPKQFLALAGKPVICRCLETFEQSKIIDDVVIVSAADYVSYCRDEIVGAYGYTKVSKVVPGGLERYDSVYEGLKAAEESAYVFIHDAARPCLTQDLIERLYSAVRRYGAVTAAVRVKDTIKTAGADGCADDTLDRSRLWSIQTPQVFSYPQLRSAYEIMLQSPHADITDDTMVMERYAGKRVYLVEGSYLNQKITVPEDLIIMEAAIRQIFY